MKPQINNIVTTNKSVEAYYSGYGNAAICNFDPGDVGYVVSICPPVVCSICNRVECNHNLYIVDFQKRTTSGIETRRVSLREIDIVVYNDF